MTAPRPSRQVILLALLLLPAVAGLLNGGVVLNEVMYHPPDDDDSLQFIELHNAGTEPVALAGWQLTRGARFTAPAATLAPGGFAVICRQIEPWQRAFGTNVPVLGVFEGTLKHGGERLELTDAQSRVVDAFKYDDAAPWPTGPDGNGSSLERISPAGRSDDPHNWAAAIGSTPTRLAATPGQTNAVFSPRRPPVVEDVRFAAPVPGAPTTVSVTINPAAELHTVELRFQSIGDAPVLDETVVSMNRTGAPGTYVAAIPAQPAGRLLRFRVRVSDAAGSTRIVPAPGEPRPTFSAYLQINTNRLTVPEVFLLPLGPRESAGPSMRQRSRRSVSPALRGQSVFMYFPTNGGPVQTFDHVRLTPRSGGWKVRLHKDAPLDGMTTLNVVYEHKPRWVLSEPLSYEVFRRTGTPAPKTGHFRVWLQGVPLGYHLWVEQPNSSFLRRWQLDPDGNLYKLLWYGEGVVGQHEKKNHPESGHKDLLSLIAGLENRQGDAQWAFIQQQFNVDELANYFAASMCVQNWDGFFNNYFAYRTPGADGKWMMIPWDQDKTWGDYDGASPSYDWYELPLTYGMKGDREPSRRFSLFRPRNSPWGVTGWWRPGGYFSAPLLANPQFRDRFLTRLREVCQTVFTEQNFRSAIDDLGTRLEPEVHFRALCDNADPAEAVSAFRRDLDSFRRQLKNRRAYLLSELDKLPPAQ